ncbi:hypothetical protein O7614_26585 [Micromonospora sp. WMMD961]|uniref:hypothetical protein n=1 Tax=Micromonospora sp. WMMD961 TaxID=3016100 RepID=UPI002416A625|nr:hypothetical protein [Micromonospora sp. WMMD961]MDG4783232.1 hypothetical protein [Micromonospora sp. WMMD961]
MTAVLARPSQLGQIERASIMELPRNGKKQPLIVPIGGGKPKAYTRVTTYIDCLEDKSNLGHYDERYVLAGVALQPTMLNRVMGLNPDDSEDKKVYKQVAARAKATAGQQNKADRGSHLHDLSEYVDRGEALPACSEADVRDMAAYKIATAMLDVKHIEQAVVVDENKTAGTPDRVSEYDGLDPDGEPAGNLITDLKTGSVEYGAQKMAMQLADYSRGKLYDPSRFPVDVEDEVAFAAWKKTEFTAEQAAAAYSELPNVNQRWGLIVHLPAGTGQCTVYWINLAEGWRGVELAGKVREWRRTKVMQPFSAG